MWPRPDDRALRSIALFVERTPVLSHSNNAQTALSLPKRQSSHNQFGEATSRRPIPCETATVQPTLIIDTIVRNGPILSDKPLVPRTTPVSRCEELKGGYRTRLIEHSVAPVGYAGVRRQDSTLCQPDPVGPRPPGITPSRAPLSFCGFANATTDATAGSSLGRVHGSITSAFTRRAYFTMTSKSAFSPARVQRLVMLRSCQQVRELRTSPVTPFRYQALPTVQAHWRLSQQRQIGANETPSASG